MTYSSARMCCAGRLLRHWSPIHLAKMCTLLGYKHRTSFTADPRQHKKCPKELVEAV